MKHEDFVIGKKYFYRGNPITGLPCVGKTTDGRAIYEMSSGNVCVVATPEMWLEYKEPVVHKRDVVWVTPTEKNNFHPKGFVSTITVEFGAKLNSHPDFPWKEIGRSPIEFIEK